MGEAKTSRRIEGLVAAALYGSLVTGLLGWVLVLAFFLDGQGVAAGICLAASALAFGLLGNALLGGSS